MKKLLRALRPETISEVDFPPGVRPLRNHRARRLSLRLDIYSRCVVLNIPRRASLARAREFARQNSVWIEKKLASLPRPVPFAHGGVIPFFGADHEIVHASRRARQATGIENGKILVHGDPAHISRRLRDFLVAQAREKLHEMTKAKAALLGKELRGFSLRDTRSRWGSCNVKGEICLSWRLIFAPEHVIEYIVAHEVAHLEHMHHRKSFWKLCDSLCADGPGARQWLKKHGQALNRYGQQGGGAESLLPLSSFSGSGQEI